MNKNLFFRKPFRYTFFNATLFLILINILVYVVSIFIPLTGYYLGLSPYGVIKMHGIWQFVTYMFVHGGFRHIFFNMLGLLFFGFTLERAMGSKEFLLFYFTCGILSGVLSFAVFMITKVNVLLIGASGAIYAVLFAYAVGFPKSMIYIWGLLPVPAPILVGAYAVIEIVSEIFGSSNTAHLTHLFGFLIAWIYFLIRMGIHPIKIWIDAYKN